MPDKFAETHLLRDQKEPKERLKLLATFFLRHRERLRLMVDLRLDPRLRRRVDPSDALQDVFLEASRRLGEYLREPRLPLFLWLRGLTGQTLNDLHAFHLGAQKRSAYREVSLDKSLGPGASSVALIAHLAATGKSPIEAAIRAEERRRLQKALEGMDPLDREVLVLRYFEQLSGAETARVLGIGESAARKRYLRALERLRGELGK